MEYHPKSKVKTTIRDPRSGWALRALFHTFCERSLGEKAAENTFEWESTVRSGSQVDSSTQALPPGADQLSEVDGGTQRIFGTNTIDIYY